MTPHRALLAVSVLVAATATARGQTATPARGASRQPPPAPIDALDEGVTSSRVGLPEAFVYDAEDRRDPFVSPQRPAANSPRPAPVARAPGLAGLGAAEITLRGVIVSLDKTVAIIEGADRRAYVVAAGQKLADGQIRSIDTTSLVVRLNSRGEVRRSLQRSSSERAGERPGSEEPGLERPSGVQ